MREVTVVLEDHYTGAEINAAVARGGGFADAFPGETAGELDALRELFQRKALVAREGRWPALLAGGASPEASSRSVSPSCPGRRCGALPGAARGARDRRTTPTRRRS